MSLAHHQATLKLNFLIVGAGVAGLSAGYSLARCGHHVRILERYPSLDDIPVVGGVRLPPNAVKMLAENGFAEDIDKLGYPIQGSTMFSMYTGEVVGYVNWLEIIKEIGGRFILMHHTALHRMLYRGCIQFGAQVDFGATVESVTSGATSSDSPTATLTTGEVLKADIIIGADGWSSVVRNAVDEYSAEYKPSGLSAYTGTIPQTAIEQDKELQELLLPSKNGMEWIILMGSNRFILGYPAGHDGYNVHVFLPDEEMQGVIDEGMNDLTWDHKIPTSTISVEGYSPLAQKLIKLLPPAVVRTPYTTREVEEWVDETSRIILVGEAAHSLRPCGTYTTSTSIEDAAMLGWLFAQLGSWDQIPSLTEAYQDMRQKRVEGIAHAETMNVELVTVPTGPDQEERDRIMREEYARSRQPELVSDDMLAEQWESLATIYAYNPEEDAEDWWVGWGQLRERANDRNGNTMQMKWDIIDTVVDETPA